MCTIFFPWLDPIAYIVQYTAGCSWLKYFHSKLIVSIFGCRCQASVCGSKRWIIICLLTQENMLISHLKFETSTIIIIIVIIINIVTYFKVQQNEKREREKKHSNIQYHHLFPPGSCRSSVLYFIFNPIFNNRFPHTSQRSNKKNQLMRKMNKKYLKHASNKHREHKAIKRAVLIQKVIKTSLYGHMIISVHR